MYHGNTLMSTMVSVSTKFFFLNDKVNCEYRKVSGIIIKCSNYYPKSKGSRYDLLDDDKCYSY